MSVDSRLSLSEQPTRISAVQFHDDVIDHDDQQQVLTWHAIVLGPDLQNILR